MYIPGITPSEFCSNINVSLISIIIEGYISEFEIELLIITPVFDEL